jgi:serine/threonine protein kinase
MAPAALHPPDDSLAAYGLGQLADPVADEVARHLEACPACRRRVADLPADDFLGRLRDAAGAKADTSRPNESVPDGPPVTALPPELAAAAQYADIRELGRGGMGVVYLARNTIMDRLEVLKVVTRSADRFLREIQAAARLKHPNVVGAYSAQRIGGVLVFAMEYVPGEDLAQLVKARGPLPIAHACNYAHQAALGLQHAHENGMVHRDIKPSNLILARDGNKPVVKILDFGLAKGTSETGIDASQTAEGAMLGTPDYVAPEQTLDAAKADIRSDIYSLGCTLYHLLSGRPPFTGRSLYEILRAHHSTEAVRLSTLRAEVPDELAGVVARMMAKDPARRFATPAAVSAALTPFFKPGARSNSPSLSVAPPAVPRPPVPARLEPAPRPPATPPPLPVPKPVPQEERVIVRRPATRPVVDRRRARRVAYRVAGLVAVALLVVGTAGLIIKTRNGTIVLEGLPADAEVLVDGERVRVKRNGDEAIIRVSRGGPHGLLVKLGDRELRTSDATVTLGGDPVRIRVEGYAPTPEPVPIPPAVGASRPAAGPGPASPARDLFAAGTTWRGVRIVEHGQYQGGTGFYELHVDTRDGEKFTGHVVENGPNRNPCAVTGTLRDNAIEWTEVPQFAPLRLAKMRGTRDGTVISVTFTCNDNGKFANDGRGRLIRVPRPGEAKPDDFVPIFDGRSLDGWEAHPSQEGGWTVDKFGKLVGSGSAVSHLYTRRAGYGDVHVKVRAKVTKGTGGGVFVRSGFGPAAGTVYPDGYQAQISAAPAASKTGGLFLPPAGKGRAETPPSRPGPPVDRWFDLDVIAAGPTVRVLIDGLETARADGQTTRPGGRIALQVHDPDTVVEFASVAAKELTPAAPAAAPGGDTVAFVPLFNGKDLTGWKTHSSQPGNWRVDAGVLIGSGGKLSHLFTDRADYKDFHLRAETRINDGGYGGIHYRTPFGDRTGSDWTPLGYQAHVGTSGIVTGSLARGAPAARGGHRFLVANRELPVPAGQWFALEVVAQGDRHTVRVNGKVTAEAVDPDRMFSAGHLALEQFPNTVTEYRKIEIRELPAPKAAAVAPAGPKDRRARDVDGRWRVEGDELVQEATAGYTHLSFGDVAWSDYDFTCDVKRTGGASELLLKYHVSPAGSETFGLGGWGNTLDFATSIRPGKPWNQRRNRTVGVQSDRWYTTHVRVRGTHCECSCDGRLLFSYDDPGNRKGAPGLGTNVTAARFKNIRVTGPDGQPLWEGLPDLTTDRKAPAAAPIDPKVRASFTNRGEWSIDGTEIVQGDDREGDCEIVFGDPAWADYNFVCEAKVVQGFGGEIGQTFRVADTGRYEWVLGRWNGHNYSVGSVARGEILERIWWSPLDREDRDRKLELDRWYRMEVRVRGSALECFVDGASVAKVEHNRYKDGRVGLRTYKTQARFRNLKVTDPSGKVLFEGLPEMPAKVVDWIVDS